MRSIEPVGVRIKHPSPCDPPFDAVRAAKAFPVRRRAGLPARTGRKALS